MTRPKIRRYRMAPGGPGNLYMIFNIGFPNPIRTGLTKEEAVIALRGLRLEAKGKTLACPKCGYALKKLDTTSEPEGFRMDRRCPRCRLVFMCTKAHLVEIKDEAEEEARVAKNLKRLQHWTRLKLEAEALIVAHEAIDCPIENASREDLVRIVSDASMFARSFKTYASG